MIPWNEDNPHYQSPPDGWPPSNVDALQQKSATGFLSNLRKASPLKWLIGELKSPQSLGTHKFPVGTMPAYTVDVVSGGSVVDVVYGYSVYGGGPTQEIATFAGSFEGVVQVMGYGALMEQLVRILCAIRIQ